MSDLRVGVRELRRELTRYLREANQGRRILVTSREVVIAEIGAPAPGEKAPPRPFGVLAGKIWIAEDFDVWPEDMLDRFEQ